MIRGQILNVVQMMASHHEKDIKFERTHPENHITQLSGRGSGSQTAGNQVQNQLHFYFL